MRMKRRLFRRESEKIYIYKGTTNNWLQSTCSLFGFNFRAPIFFILRFLSRKLFELYIQNGVCFSTMDRLGFFFVVALSQVSQSIDKWHKFIRSESIFYLPVELSVFMQIFRKLSAIYSENWRTKLMKTDSDVFILYAMRSSSCCWTDGRMMMAQQ